MEFFGGPAALGAIMMCLMLGAWTLGHWQGSIVPGGPRSHEAEPSPADHIPVSAGDQAGHIPCQQAARDERRRALDLADSLGDLHAEVSAYRRAQQVLASLASEPLELSARRSGTHQACRYLGLTGHPTCAMPAAVRRACAEGAGCSDPGERAGMLVQPSDFTRV